MFISTTLDFIVAIQILWTMESNLDDFYGNYLGVGINSPTFSFPSIHGYGRCLDLNAAASQSVAIYSPPFINMAYTSFSLVLWVKATSLWSTTAVAPFGDNALFGQTDQNGQDRSLHLTLRNRRPYFGFYGDDIQGNIIISPNVWYHVCFVYGGHQISIVLQLEFDRKQILHKKKYCLIINIDSCFLLCLVGFCL